MNRVIISSITSMMDILGRNTSLFAVPSLAALRPIYNRMNAPNTGCSRCNKATPDISAYRATFESALKVMPGSDQQQMKSLLHADEICYYVRNANNTLELKCF
jgi:hypothetical protein